MRSSVVALVSFGSFVGAVHAQDLNIDFNSTTQDAGPHNNAGFQAYDAGHEVALDFDTETYTAFGTDVSITPAWPNTTDNRVQQMVDRGAVSDASWLDTDIDLITDWLGIDTRTGNGGNGNWDGTTGTPTHLTLTLAGLPADIYRWTSFHHDTDNVHGGFAVWESTDSAANFTRLADGYMSDGRPGGNPDSNLDGSAGPAVDFAEMSGAGSIYETTITPDGTHAVVLRFAPYSGVLGDAVDNQLFGINGFELTAVPESPRGSPIAIAVLLLLGIRSRRQPG